MTSSASSPLIQAVLMAPCPMMSNLTPCLTEEGLTPSSAMSSTMGEPRHLRVLEGGGLFGLLGRPE